MCVPGPVLDSGDTAVAETDKDPGLMEPLVQWDRHPVEVHPQQRIPSKE